MKTEVSFGLLLSVLKKNVVWILIIAVVAAGIAFALTSMAKPVYATSASFYVINDNNSDYTQSALVTAAQALALDYIEIIKSDRVLTPVCEKLKYERGYEYTTDQLRAMIECSVKTDTAVFIVQVKGTDKNATQAIINVIEEEAGNVIDDTVKRKDCIELLTPGGEAKVVSAGRITNSVLALIVAAIAGYVLFLGIALFDNTIHTEEDLKKKFDVPIIGAIPVWDVSEKSK